MSFARSVGSACREARHARSSSGLKIAAASAEYLRYLCMVEKIKIWAKRLKRDGVTLWFACKDPRTPWSAKAIAGFVVAYALSPIDPIPDFIPILGLLDELLLLPGLIWLAVRLVPAEVLSESRTQADLWMQEKGKKPRTRWGIVLVAVLWTSLAGLSIVLLNHLL